MSEYKPNQVNPIFGDKGYHSGDTAEDLPGTAAEKAREEKEKAAAEAAELKKQAAEEKKLREEEENSYINGDFQTLLDNMRPAKRLLSDAERTAASIPVPHPMEVSREEWDAQALAAKPEINIPSVLPESHPMEMSLADYEAQIAARPETARPEETRRNVNIPESHPMEMSPAELEAQVEQQVDKIPEKTLESQVAKAAPNLTPEQTKQVVEELQKPENKSGIIKRMKDKIGAFVAGGAGGYAGSMVARVFISTGIRSVFGTTLGVGIAAGAIAGGSVEGVKSYLKERNKFSADDIISRLDSSKSDVESAVVISEANKALQEARISHPERVPALTQKIQEAQVKLEAKIKSPEFKNESEKNKIAFILKTSETARDNINREQKKEIKALIKEIKFKTEKSEVNWNKVMKSTGKGALIGALGGTLGGLASGWIAEHLGHQGVDGLTTIHAGHVGQAYSSAIENGRDGVMSANYAEHVLAGDKGLTEEARNAIHDYMINLHSLGAGQAPHLSTEQYIYAEDWIVKNALDHGSTVLHPGDVVNVPGDMIQKALEHAQNLSQDQLTNLTELISHQPHLISQHTADWLNNFDYANPENGQAAAALLGQAGSAAEYVINDPGMMEAAAWASGALPEASYQMGREATHFIWHMAGKDADAEARGISETEANKTLSSEKTELPAGTFLADTEEKTEAESSELPYPEINKLIDSYKDLKIQVPKNLEDIESAALGLKLLRVLHIDPNFHASPFYQTLKGTKFKVGITSARNKEGVVARKTGIYMYIDNSHKITTERAQTLMDSLHKKLEVMVTKETPASAAAVENSPENNAENLENLPKVRDLIKVRRNNGDIEDGWLVLDVDGPKKIISVIKTNTGDETLLKNISFENYQSSNKPEGTTSAATESQPQNQPESQPVDQTGAATEEESANTEAEVPETNRIVGNPNIRSGNLSTRERRSLEANQQIVKRMDLNWPQRINDQSKDAFSQELISIVEKIRAERNDLLPYLRNIKLDLAENSNNLQAADIKLNPNGRYNINIQAPQTTIYAELLPILEDLQRTATPT